MEKPISHIPQGAEKDVGAGHLMGLSLGLPFVSCET